MEVIMTKKAGFGCYIIGDGINEKLKGIVPDEFVSKSLKHVSGELWGALESLKFVLKKNIKSVNLLYDYEGIRPYALNIWYSTSNFIKNICIPAINNIRSMMNANFVHISSHSNVMGNDIADQLAKNAVGYEADEKKNNS